MGLGTLLLLVSLAVMVLCAAVWAACARWLRTGLVLRLAAATVLPLMSFWLVLWLDDRPFNMVVFALFLVPLLLIEGGLLLLLERSRSRALG